MSKPRIPTYAFVSAWVLLVVAVWFFFAKEAPVLQLLVLTALAYLACWGGFFWFSDLSRRQKGFRFLTVNLSVLLAVAFAEACSVFNAVDYRVVFGRPVQPWENTRNLPDRDLIHIHRPHHHARGHLAGDLIRPANAAPATLRKYDVQYDQNGFRNQVDYAEADCIVIGDSFVEAGNVLWNELHTTHMAEALDWKIVNLGQARYGPQQELIVLNRFGLALHPKICVWVFFEGNDLSDVWKYKDFVENPPEPASKISSLKVRSFTKNALAWLGTRLTSQESTVDVARSGVFTTPEGATQLWFGYAGGELSDRDLAALDKLKGAAEKGSLLYYPDDSHWSPEGHRLVARSLSDVLRAKYSHLFSKLPESQ